MCFASIKAPRPDEKFITPSSRQGSCVRLPAHSRDMAILVPSSIIGEIRKILISDKTSRIVTRS